MKTLLKLIIVLAAFGFVTANAELTVDQTAAIKIVTDAVATGIEKDIKTAVNNQIAQFPEIAAQVVTAALNVSGVSVANIKIIVRVAAFTAPNQLEYIKSAIAGISDAVIGNEIKLTLNNLATTSALNGSAILSAAKNDGKILKKTPIANP